MDKLRKEAKKTKEQGVVIYAVGVGTEFDEKALLSISTHHKLHTVDTYENLNSLSVQLAVGLCQG